MGGFITTGTGNWRNFFWVIAGMVALNLIMSIIMLPETSYPTSFANKPATSSPASSLAIDGDKNHTETETVENANRVVRNDQPTWFQVYMKNSWFLYHPHIHHPRSWLGLTFDPFRMLFVPGVAGLSLLFGMHIAWAVTISINVANHFGAPPYLWPSSHLGMINLAPTTGLIIGFFFGGYGADWLANRAVRKAIQNGTHDAFVDENGDKVDVRGEPEARLPIIVFAGIISPLGFLLAGIFFSRDMAWIAITSTIAMGAFGITAACNVYLTYCIDSYKPYAAQLSVTINVFKNCLGFGASYAGIAWYHRSGYLSMFGTIAGLLWVVYLLIIPVYIWGKTTTGVDL